MRPIIRYFAIGAIVLVAAVYLFLGRASQPPSAPDARPGAPSGSADRAILVNAVVVHAEPFAERVVTTGTILADEEVELRSETAGRIVSINFQEGSRVAAGQLLVKINDADLQAQLKKNESQVRIAVDNEERQRTLLDKNLTSREQYEIALNQLNSVRAESLLVRANIAKTEVRAPFDGVIGLRYISVGSYVSSSSRIASLIRLKIVKIDFSIPERFAVFVRPGASVLVRTQGIADRIPASVYAIEPKIDPSTRTVQVRATAANVGERIKPGGFAQVELVVNLDPSALMIPTEAIVPILKGQQVFRLRGSSAEAVDVELGTRTERAVQVIHGLSTGDTVIVSGILQLSNGTRVRINALR